MRTPLKRFPPTIAFLLICVVSAVVLWVGLRMYFNQARLDSLLTQTFSGVQWQALAGQVQTENTGTLLVQTTDAQDNSLISLKPLSIDTRFYARLILTFADKHTSQPLTLRVSYRQQDYSEQTKYQPILYTDNKVSRFTLNTLLPSGSVIDAVSLQTRTLIEPYRLSSIRFEPKQIDNTGFLQLLGQGFLLNDSTISSTDNHIVHNWILLPPKVLVILYFAIVGILFSLFLLLAERPLVSAWWTSLISAWLVLDAHYLLGKTLLALQAYQSLQLSAMIPTLLNATAVLLVTVFVSAWLAGFAVIRPFLKQRYGYVSFAVGMGYLVGLGLLSLLLTVYSYWQRPWAADETLLFMCLIAVPLLFFLRAKSCSIEELRLEKAPSNATYALVVLLLILVLYRWGLIGGMLLLQTTSSTFLPSELLTLSAILPADIVQIWQPISGLPWLFGIVALWWLMLGGLRYIGVKLLPAALTAYAVLSLPMLDSSLNIGVGVDVLVAMALLAAVFVLAAVLSYQEWRLLNISAVMILLITGIQADTIAVIAIIVLMMLIGRVLGVLIVSFMVTLAIVGMLLLDGNLLSAIQLSLGQIFVDGNQLSANENKILIYQEWLISNNWHTLLLAATGSILCLWLSRRSRDRQGAEQLIAAAATGLCVMTASVLFTDTVMTTTEVSRLLLLVAPVIILIPVAVHQLITQDNETLPPI